MRNPVRNKRRTLALLATLVALLLGALEMRAQTDDYQVPWFTVDCGGGTRTAFGDYQLGGTIGQPDAGSAAGGIYTVTGGFWALVSPEAQALFGDSFETGDAATWSQVAGVDE